MLKVGIFRHLYKVRDLSIKSIIFKTNFKFESISIKKRLQFPRFFDVSRKYFEMEKIEEKMPRENANNLIVDIPRTSNMCFEID